MGRFIRIAKLATIRHIDEAIEKGKLVNDDVANEHDSKDFNKNFAYIEYQTEIDGSSVVLKLSIKKSQQKNKFWVHSIYVQKNATERRKNTKNSVDKPYISAGIDDSITQKEPIVKSSGKVFYDERINLDDLTQKQQDEIEFAGTVIAAIGNTVYFYNSQYAPKDSREARTNGWYDPKDGSIHLDIAKIERGEESVLFTLSHELVHFIEDWSPAKYQTFANFLLKEYAEHGVSTDKLVHQKMAELKTTDYDYAMSELVADACERMLLDSNAAQKLAELNKTDKGLAQKIKDFFANVLKRIRNAYANYKGRTEAQYLQKMDDVLSEFHEMFAEALTDASRNYQDADGKLGDSEVREQAKKYPLAKKKNSWYNQYTTVALQWAHSDRTKPGDRKVVYEAGKGYHLIEAMEDGYFEVFTGSYEEVERYDSTYRSSVETFYGNIEALSNDERGNIRNLRDDRNGRHDVGHGESVPGGHDASRSDEHLRSSNKGKSSFVEKDQAKEQRKLNSTREILANVDLKTADFSKRGGDQLAAHLKDYQEKEEELKKHEAKVRSLSENILKMRHDRENGKPYVSSEMDALLTERNRETILASQVRRSMQLITTAPVVKDFVQREKLTAWRQNRDEIERGKMERVRVTELKQKARKKAETLNKMLTKPTKKIHIKSGLQKSVASFLYALNLDTVNYANRIKFLETRMRFAEREVEEELKRSGITKQTADAFEEQFIQRMERRVQEIQNSKEWAELRQMSMLDKVSSFRSGLKEFLSSEDAPTHGQSVDMILEMLDRNEAFLKSSVEQRKKELQAKIEAETDPVERAYLTVRFDRRQGRRG